MKQMNLSGEWSLRHEALSVIGLPGLKGAGGKTQGWIPARVPGEVHLDLCRAGLMEEPLFSTNAPACRWPEDRSWWYRRVFTLPQEWLEEEEIELVFGRLDYYAQIFLNGVLLGESENAFIPALFAVKHRLNAGENTLIIRLTAGTERAVAQTMGESSANSLYGNRGSFAGIRELRKPQFSYGWDWVDSLPNIGIGEEVGLRGFSRLRVADLRAVTKLIGGACTLEVTADIQNLHPWAEQEGRAELVLLSPAGERLEASTAFLAPVGQTRIPFLLTVPAPELWWPNGMGAQPLYTLSLRVMREGRLCDVWERKIGLRTVSVDRSPLPVGSRFCIRVNGEDVFCRGGNWIPADAIMARVDLARYESLVGAARDANLNMLRVWGGGLYEAASFYEACDRMGILVWQDFMFACSAYPDDTLAFQETIRREARTVLRRLRHHPSIVLWCGNNENIWGFKSWWNASRDYPHPELKLGGEVLYGQILPEVCLELDPDRPYWPGSPAGGEDPNSETSGDCHWWPQATMNPDLSRRYRHEVYDECISRFVSEYGVIGPCHLESVREYLRNEEIDRQHHAWRIHTNSFEKETTPAAIRYHYAEPEGLDIEGYIRYGQMFQAVLYGRSIESMRFRKNDPRDDCAGALIWMFNDCWGETGWTPIDYFLRRKASYYWIRHACAPVRALVRRRGEDLVTRVVNDSRQEQNLTVTTGFLRIDGTASRQKSRKVVVPANSMREILREPMAGVSGAEVEWIYAAFCTGDGVEAIPCTVLLKPHRELKLSPPKIDIRVQGRQITLSSAVYCHGVAHPDGGRALFTDNYFDLIPGLPRVIDCVGELPPALNFAALPAG